jgi:2-polyprenyl-3-methyl-5-hydroxy-6-metoxy-1,4-benzoquinol methylase
MNRFDEIVTKYLTDNKDYHEAYEIVRTNSDKGKIWLVGGQVFRVILRDVYKISFTQSCDFDFMVENPKHHSKIQKGDWNLIKTNFGDPRFIKNTKQIDLFNLNHAINPYEDLNLSEMSSKDKLESYFSRVPLNIQALAYDTSSKKIIGNEGMEAISKKILKVNCLEECLTFCKRRKISVRKFLNTKIKSDIFARVYPNFLNCDKTATCNYYNKNADTYISRSNFEDFIPEHVPEEINYFLSSLKGQEILDVGAGDGRDSLMFKSKGFSPTAIDISRTMVELCLKNGLKAKIQDIENCDLEDDKFDGVFAYCSLLHIPKKRIYNSIARIFELLESDGLFFIGMLEGKGETIYDSRWFSKYQELELKNILEKYFTIERFRQFKIGSQTYLNFVCKKI